MEPSDLKPDSRSDDPVEAWLRAGTDAPPLPDAGFSQRVLSALPPPSDRRRTASLRRSLCLSGAVAGALIAGLGGLALDELPVRLGAIGSALAEVPVRLATPASAFALALTAVSLAYVYRRKLGLRLPH
jgi:hypothetical protein